MSSTTTQPCGSTELRLDQQSISWNIRGASSLLQTKLLPVWKIKSPSFTSPSTHSWHLEMIQSKNEFIKCILLQDSAPLPPSPQTVQPSPSYPVLSAVSQMLQSISNMELTTGAIINNVYLLTREGKMESFAEIVSKYEETNGWREWAGKFVEKRRKSGLTEYIFGKDSDAYENALPLAYIADFHDRYVDTDDVLHLQVDLLFTSTVEIPTTDSVMISPLPPTPDTNNEVVPSTTNHKILVNENFTKRLANYYNCKSYSDVTLVAGDETFPVHKIILEARAPKFAANLFSGRVKPEPNSEGGNTGESEASGDVRNTGNMNSETITIDNIQPNILKAMLKFIYSGNTFTNDLETLSNLCREARRYDFHELIYACILKALDLFYISSSDQQQAIQEVLKEIISSCNQAVFDNQMLKLEELCRLHPVALQSVFHSNFL